MQIEVFFEILGREEFKNEVSETNEELIFVDRLYYVQAIVNQSGKVQFYSVTTRSKDFQPVFSVPSTSLDDDGAEIVLGKTTFGEMAIEQHFLEGVFGCVGAHDFSYFETYYLGNPGNYLTYVLGVNESGLFGIAQPEGTEAYSGLDEFLRDVSPDCLIYIAEASGANEKDPPNLSSGSAIGFRNEAPINTWGVVAPLEDSSTFGTAMVGPAYSQVRILD